jgi:hypothetical protein
MVSKQLLVLLPGLFFASCGSPAPGPTEVGSSAGQQRESIPQYAPESYERGAGGDVGRRFTYREGERDRELILAENLLVEFGPTNAGAELVLSALGKANELKSSTEGVRLWEFAGGDPLRVSEDLGRLETAGRYSPAFYPSSSRESIWALPGGVVVGFPALWSPTEVERFALAAGLEVDQRVTEGGMIYLLRTAPGLPSIEAANRIANDPDILWATPNFWQSASTR